MRGRIAGTGLVADGTGDGTYMQTPYKSWKLKTATPVRTLDLRVVLRVAQDDSVQTWRSELDKLSRAIRTSCAFVSPPAGDLKRPAHPQRKAPVWCAYGCSPPGQKSLAGRCRSRARGNEGDQENGASSCGANDASCGRCAAPGRDAGPGTVAAEPFRTPGLRAAVRHV